MRLPSSGSLSPIPWGRWDHLQRAGIAVYIWIIFMTIFTLEFALLTRWRCDHLQRRGIIVYIQIVIVTIFALKLALLNKGKVIISIDIKYFCHRFVDLHPHHKRVPCPKKEKFLLFQPPQPQDCKVSRILCELTHFCSDSASNANISFFLSPKAAARIKI